MQVGNKNGLMVTLLTAESGCWLGTLVLESFKTLPEIHISAPYNMC